MITEILFFLYLKALHLKIGDEGTKQVSKYVKKREAFFMYWYTKSFWNIQDVVLDLD